MTRRIPISIRFSDVDVAGHVHNAQYLNYFEAGRIVFMKDIIPTNHDWMSVGLIVARNEVDHIHPIRFNDRIEISTDCERVGVKSFTLTYSIYIVSDNEPILACTGKSVMVCYDYKTGRSIELPSEWRDGLVNKE